MSYKPKNRLHTATRWPLDPNQRNELAKTDLAFANILIELHHSVCEVVPLSVHEIHRRAVEVLEETGFIKPLN